MEKREWQENRLVRHGLLFVIILLTAILLSAGVSSADVLRIPAQTGVIESEAFRNDTSLDEVVPAEGLRQIERLAFADSSVTRFFFPDSLTVIAGDAFQGCENISGYGSPYCEGARYCAEKGIPYTAYETSPELFAYEWIDDTSARVTAFTGSDAVVVVPEMADETHAVTVIGSSVFSSRTDLEKVCLPDTVSSIESNAFNGCTGLTEITLPDGITELGNNALAYSGLKKITLPDALESLGSGVFRSCTNLAEVQFNQRLKLIDTFAFFQCESLRRADLPDSVTEIRSAAFQGCTSLSYFHYPLSLDTATGGGSFSVFAGASSLTSVTVPEGVTRLAPNLFLNHAHLTEIILPSTLTSVGDNALSGCSSLTEIALPDGVTELGYNALAYSGLTGITLPEALETLGSGAFRSCTDLAEVRFNQRLRLVDSFAFFQCESLRRADLPDSVTEIRTAAFQGCTSLSYFHYPLSLDTATGGGGFSVFTGASSLTSVTIPEGVTRVAPYLFLNHAHLTEVIFPSSLKTVGRSAFSGCTGLTSVVLPSGVTAIEDDAFRFSPGINSIYVPPTVKTIGFNAFANGTVTVESEYGSHAVSYCKTYGIPYYYLSLVSASLPSGIEYSGDIAAFRGKIISSESLTWVRVRLLRDPAGSSVYDSGEIHPDALSYQLSGLQDALGLNSLEADSYRILIEARTERSYEILADQVFHVMLMIPPYEEIVSENPVSGEKDTQDQITLHGTVDSLGENSTLLLQWLDETNQKIAKISLPFLGENSIILDTIRLIFEYQAELSDGYYDGIILPQGLLDIMPRLLILVQSGDGSRLVKVFDGIIQ